MVREELVLAAGQFAASDANRVPDGAALAPELAGMRIFEAPVFGFGSAQDALFAGLKHPDAMGPQYIEPGEWLPGAKTVVTFFLPFTKAVRAANRRDMAWPADEWLHGRIEGQAFTVALCRRLQEVLARGGYESAVPAADPRFSAVTNMGELPAGARLTVDSNWSERHAAYICGLGTFGLSKGLITEKGMAGRLGSVITTWETQADARAYDGLYANCCMCGKCAKNCPAHAISKEGGKDHRACWAFLQTVLAQNKPYYGCGKCQVNVPCEERAMRRR